jgi:hypothetical protein
VRHYSGMPASSQPLPAIAPPDKPVATDWRHFLKPDEVADLRAACAQDGTAKVAAHIGVSKDAVLRMLAGLASRETTIRVARWGMKRGAPETRSGR